jgi:hypothetical protein
LNTSSKSTPPKNHERKSFARCPMKKLQQLRWRFGDYWTQTSYVRSNTHNLLGKCSHGFSKRDRNFICEVQYPISNYFSDYHQIWLHKKDEEKTTFITPFSTYCYLRMLKSLNNAGPTFYRMIKAILKDQMCRNVFTYVDDIVVASKKKTIQIDDPAETFANMHTAQLKLNLEKYVFGIQRAKY